MVLLLHFSPPNETVNYAAYQATLKKLNRAVQHKRPQMSDKRVLLLHDNARPHTAHATVNLLERWGWEILQHPPYSPDLAPLGASMAAWSGSLLLSTGFCDMDFPPRQVHQQRR